MDRIMQSNRTNRSRITVKATISEDLSGRDDPKVAKLQYLQKKNEKLNGLHNSNIALPSRGRQRSYGLSENMGHEDLLMGIQITPQQQQLLLQQRQQVIMAQQQGLTPQQFAQLQAQQNIQNHQHQQQLLNQQQQVQQNQMGQQHQLQQMQSHPAYQAQLIRNQMAQMQMAAHKQNQQQQGGMQITPHQQQQQQQQQMLIAAAQANANQGQVPQTPQPARYQQMFKQRLQLMRADMQKRLRSQYSTPQQYPPPVAQQYYVGLENNARAWVQDLMRRENMQQQQRQAALLQQHQQQQMMAKGMVK
jgi:transcription factor SPT20